MSKYKVGGYVRLLRDDDYSESDGIQRQTNLKRIDNKDIKKLRRNRIQKYIDNIFIHEDKSIEINFKEDINSI